MYDNTPTPPPLTQWPSSVALYSGGVDSYCMSYLHNPDVLLHVNMGGRYGEAETRHMATPPGLEDRLETIHAPILGTYEHSDTKIIPGRNAMLALLATQYGDNILMGSVAASTGNDKDQEFADRFNHMCDHMLAPQRWLPNGRTVRLILPVKHITKTRLVGATLAAGHDPQLLVHNTFSCYEPTTNHQACGTCPPCGRRWAAFTVWGLDVGFNARPALQPYVDEIRAGHTAHRSPQFVADVTDAWNGIVRQDYS